MWVLGTFRALTFGLDLQTYYVCVEPTPLNILAHVTMFFLSPPLFRDVSKVLLNLGEITSAPAVTVTTVLTLLVYIGPIVEVISMNSSH